MTVSPGWPQDGNPSPEIAGQHREAVEKEVLPPTLFQLPNLKPGTMAEAPPIQQSETAEQVPPPAVEQPQPPEQVHPVEPATGAERPDVPSRSITDGMGSPDQPHAQALRTSPADDPIKQPIPPARLPVDVPAGRSWSESFGSHGIVIALLLVVVAAALITGRDGQNDDTEATLAQHSDLLEFDQGELVDIPDPVLPSVEETSESSTGQWAAQATPDVTPSSGLVAQTQRTDVDDVESTEVASVTFDPPSPQTSVADSSEAVSMPSDGVRTNGFFSQSNEVEAQTASSRSNVMPVPDFDEIAELPDASAQPRQSSTPAKITNLLQYLPPQPDAVISTPATGLGE